MWIGRGIVICFRDLKIKSSAWCFYGEVWTLWGTRASELHCRKWGATGSSHFIWICSSQSCSILRLGDTFPRRQYLIVPATRTVSDAVIFCDVDSYNKKIRFAYQIRPQEPLNNLGISVIIYTVQNLTSSLE